ncbi:MAG: hypothetical protein KUG82_18265 [Pseudomonadales bacterium]|nr:hypothetical protein [Pseudomonadales bacterium]
MVGSSAEYLDEHNGHDHDDLGYHYHITVESTDGSTPKFPYIIGPTFYGELDDNAVNSCGGTSLGGGGPPPPQ